MEQSIQTFMLFYIPLFVVMFLSVFAWFYLVWRLYKILEADHAELYREMGSPSLFWNNSPRAAFRLMKFIFKKEYLQQGNDKLKKHGHIMFIFSIMYLVVFMLLFFSVPIMVNFIAPNAINSTRTYLRGAYFVQNRTKYAPLRHAC